MELYFIDLLWILMSTSCLFLYFSERIFRLTGNQKLYNELAYFGKTRMAQTGVPKAWFKHFYIFAVVWVSESHEKSKVYLFQIFQTIFWFLIWFKYSDPVISETVNLIQIALLALSNYVLYQSTEPSFWNPHIMVRLLLKESKFVPTTGVLILIHLIQRLYESIFIQKSVSKMSVVHYIVGYAFYFLLPLQYISSEPETNLESTTTTYALLIGAILAMIGQHLS